MTIFISPIMVTPDPSRIVHFLITNVYGLWLI